MSSEIFDAIEAHDMDLLTLALSRGDDPNALGAEPLGWQPLHAAIEELEYGGPIEALVLLLRYGAKVDAYDAQQDTTPLLMAVFRGQTAAICILLTAGADPNVVGSEGDSPLRWSVEQHNLEMAAMLLRCGATKTLDRGGGPSGMNALGRAAMGLDLPMLELLLRMGADPEAHDLDGRKAFERLPPRTEDRAADWNAAMALLRGSTADRLRE